MDIPIMELDAHILDVLPVKNVVGTKYSGESAWAKTYEIKTQLPGGETKSYFLKVSVGQHGKQALMGEFDSTSTIYSVAPDFTNNPIAWGSLRNNSDTHFYLCEFRRLSNGLPAIEPFCKRLASLHRNSVSPNGKFGFHVVTYNGNLPQNNNYTDTWEDFFLAGLKHMITLNLAACGRTKIQELAPAMYEKVVPRLLRPLETNGRCVKPSLVHGDLWCGNVSTDIDSQLPIIFDPCCFYGHNEYEFGNWRQARNKFTTDYVDAYHSHIEKAEPKDDWDDRNALYAIRFNLHAATLFPNEASFRDSVIEEMERLIETFPQGFDGFVET